MRQQLAIVRSACWGMAMAATLALLALPDPVRAEEVLERIARTGVFSAGTRADALPFAYRDGKGRLVGFSVDLLEQIHQRLEQRFGRPIDMQLRAVTASNRIEWVASHAIDIECGITTPTWKREEAVDFSIPFFGNGTRIMTLRSTATQLNELRGKRIGVAAGATTANILGQHAPEVAAGAEAVVRRVVLRVVPPHRAVERQFRLGHFGRQHGRQRHRNYRCKHLCG